MKIIGIIPARMQSSRFYGKPLAKILGKEMILWVYEHCKESSILNNIFVATDHEDIAAFCSSKFIPYVMTSSEHKSCCDRTNEACQKIGADIVVEVQGDEPTLLAEEIDKFVNKIQKEEKYDLAMLYTDILPEQVNDPNVVKLVVNSKSRAIYFSRSPIPHNFKSRPVKYYKQIGLYLWKSEVLKRFSETPIGPIEIIEDTQVLRVVENDFDAVMVYTPNNTIGVDVYEDIKKAEEFLNNI